MSLCHSPLTRKKRRFLLLRIVLHSATCCCLLLLACPSFSVQRSSTRCLILIIQEEEEAKELLLWWYFLCDLLQDEQDITTTKKRASLSKKNERWESCGLRADLALHAAPTTPFQGRSRQGLEVSLLSIRRLSVHPGYLTHSRSIELLYVISSSSLSSLFEKGTLRHLIY